jgi:hypothetical protein
VAQRTSPSVLARRRRAASGETGASVGSSLSVEALSLQPLSENVACSALPAYASMSSRMLSSGLLPSVTRRLNLGTQRRVTVEMTPSAPSEVTAARKRSGS